MPDLIHLQIFRGYTAQDLCACCLVLHVTDGDFSLVIAASNIEPFTQAI